MALDPNKPEDVQTRKYRAGEFADLSRSVASGFKIKIIAEHSEESRDTKWLSVSAEEAEEVIQLLMGNAVAIKRFYGELPW